MPKTLLGWLNYVILQWFCIRLARVTDIDTGRTHYYRVLGLIVPMTGWWSDYVYLWRILG